MLVCCGEMRCFFWLVDDSVGSGGNFRGIGCKSAEQRKEERVLFADAEIGKDATEQVV